MDYRNLSLEELLNYTSDHESWYFIGMAYWKKNDLEKAADWLEKTMNDPGNDWAGTATFNLAQLHTMAAVAMKKINIDEANLLIDEALRLYEKMLMKKPKSSMAAIHAGLLYYSEKNNFSKGKKLVEDGIEFLIEEDGNDNYLRPDECFKIARMYDGEGNSLKTIEYLIKTRDRCDIRYPSDRELKEMAENNLRALGG